MKTNIQSFILLCTFLYNSALDKQYFFPSGSSNGDIVLVDVSNGIGLDRSDDGAFPVDIEHIPFFDLATNTKIQISPNGYVGLLGSPVLDQPFPTDFPRLLSVSPAISAPQIAIFHTDLLFTFHMMSQLTYQMHTTGAALNLAKTDIMALFGRSFTPTKVLVITWKYAEPFSSLQTAQNATFQMALATDDQQTYLFMHYGEININEFRPTAIGWQEGNPLKFFRHPLTQLLPDVNNVFSYRPKRLSTESNVGVPGKWIFRVAKPYIDVTVTTPPTGTPIQVPTCPTSDSNVCLGKEGNIAFPGQENFFISCAAGHQPICQPCPIGLKFVEQCNQCLLSLDSDCAPTLPPVTASLPTIPFNGCSQERAKAFCSNKSSGRYANPFDNKDSSFFWCVGIGAYCQRCALGTVFCATGPASGVCK